MVVGNDPSVCNGSSTATSNVNNRTTIEQQQNNNETTTKQQWNNNETTMKQQWNNNKTTTTTMATWWRMEWTSSSSACLRPYGSRLGGAQAATTQRYDFFGGLGQSALIRRTNILRWRVERNPRSSSTSIGLWFTFGDGRFLLDRSAYILQTFVRLHFTIGIAHAVTRLSTSIVALTTNKLSIWLPPTKHFVPTITIDETRRELILRKIEIEIVPPPHPMCTPETY